MTETTDDMPEELARLTASPLRRYFAVGVLALLGLLLIYMALARPPSIGWQGFLILLGAGAIWAANALRLSTAQPLVLTRQDLREASGRVLAEVDQIKSVDRTLFAFKPSNGFLIHLKDKAPGHWAPGLWWRFGRRVGVGGVTAAAQTKSMAEILAFVLAERDAG